MSDSNPNQLEACIDNITTLWNELKILMDGSAENPKYPGVVTGLLKGRPITHEQYALFDVKTRDLKYDLSHLIRAPKATDDVKIVAIDMGAIEARMVESQNQVARVSEFQRQINELLGDYVDNNDLQTDLLEGEGPRVTFRYEECERAWRADQNDAVIPQALIDDAEQRGVDLLDHLVERMGEEGEYNYFDSMECDDSETIDSSLQYERHG